MGRLCPYGVKRRMAGVRMGFAPQEIARTTLGEAVLAALHDMIAAGNFQPGEHLKEADLALALNVSRGPIRDAFTQLASEGHIVLRPHRGAFMTVLSQADVEEVHSLRLAIEQLAAQLACVRMGEEEFAVMDAVLGEMELISGDVEPRDAVRLDLRFHDLIYQFSGHQRVQRVWSSLRSQVSFFLHTRNVHYPDFVHVGHSEHLELRNALSIRNPDVARAAVSKHLAGAYERLKKLPLPDTSPVGHLQRRVPDQ
ncbi:MAG: transcriptional regulator, GntR family [Micrococcaceae bacterium]|jgi:DNA-binding GntR family transcriptional regulator|nr:transcriptional regulator, GntR family [Micrococcaceae bacterium]